MGLLLKISKNARKHVVILRDFVYNSAMCVGVGNISFYAAGEQGKVKGNC